MTATPTRCWCTTPQTPRSPNAHRITDSYLLILGVTGAIFVIVEGALITFVIRYRRGGRSRDAEGPQIHGATRLEIIWTVIPVLIIAGIVSFVFYELPAIKNAPKASAAGPQLHVTVEAHQFYWLFRYPNGAVSINTSRSDYRVVKEFRMMRFDGERWQPFGPILAD